MFLLSLHAKVADYFRCQKGKHHYLKVFWETCGKNTPNSICVQFQRASKRTSSPELNQYIHVLCKFVHVNTSHSQLCRLFNIIACLDLKKSTKRFCLMLVICEGSGKAGSFKTVNIISRGASSIEARVLYTKW